MTGPGKWIREKLWRESSWMSMKFLVAPESMSAVVSMFLFFPCSRMGKWMVQLLGEVTSTQFIEWEEDIEVTSLFKNPILQEWRSQLSPQMVLCNRLLRHQGSVSLFPEVFSEFTYLSRAQWGVGVKGFFEGLDFRIEVSEDLTFWGWGVVDGFQGEVTWHFFTLCPAFQHLKHHPSFIHLAHSIGVSFEKVMVSTLSLINPSCTSGGDSSHGKDHGGNFLV